MCQANTFAFAAAHKAPPKHHVAGTCTADASSNETAVTSPASATGACLAPTTGNAASVATAALKRFKVIMSVSAGSKENGVCLKNLVYVERKQQHGLQVVCVQREHQDDMNGVGRLALLMSGVFQDVKGVPQLQRYENQRHQG